MNRLPLPSEQFPFCLLLSRLEASLTLFHDLFKLLLFSQIQLFQLSCFCFSRRKKRGKGSRGEKRREEEKGRRNLTMSNSNRGMQANTLAPLVDRQILNVKSKTDVRHSGLLAKRETKTKREREREFFLKLLTSTSSCLLILLILSVFRFSRSELAPLHFFLAKLCSTRKRGCQTLVNLNESKPKKKEKTQYISLFCSKIEVFESTNQKNEYECRLADVGFDVGVRMLELLVHREKAGKRENRILGILSFLHTNVWKSLFGKTADSLERGTSVSVQ